MPEWKAETPHRPVGRDVSTAPTRWTHAQEPTKERPEAHALVVALPPWCYALSSTEGEDGVRLRRMRVPTFVYLLKPVRPGLASAPSPDEERILDVHFQRLEEALARQRLILAGPCVDGSFGIVVFRAGSQAEALAFMEGDPAITEGLMTATLHPFRVSLLETGYRTPSGVQGDSGPG